MKARTISIPVIATDGGGRSAYTKVNVLLRDKNDNPPVFEFTEYQAYVKADTPVGTKIMKVWYKCDWVVMWIDFWEVQDHQKVDHFERKSGIFDP